MARKILITESKVLDALRRGEHTLHTPPETIITALALDTARDRGLTFVTSAETVPASPTEARTPTHVIALGSDHGGFGYKQTISTLIDRLGWRILDLGTDSEAACDYPDFAFAVARAVSGGQADFGIMIDGAGIGSAMVCNKVSGIRAACAYNEFTAWNARAHNDANVLTLGSRTMGIEVCKRMVQTFLETSFEGGRHQKRVAKIADVEARFSRED